ncbi:MAG TPA: CusA/CzcA family heavy metal efflux RND transporter [Puia sp.]|nr:CusA/CzcA family heavy metal efflux RND transporter [Puia sp.]
MVQRLIEWSLRNRLIVLVLAAGLLGWGFYSVRQNPIDAIPDLSENQVIVFSEWQGRSPQIMEDQVTYPLVSNLQGIPRVKNVRGTSMFGMSFVYVIFDDDVDVYWARSRVLERLSYAQRLLPADVVPTLGPDGTGVGHVFWYTLEAKGMNLGDQRALQDWYVKLALQTVPGVAEVASFGGFEKQYQVVVDPVKLQYYRLSMMDVARAVRSNNNDVGGRKFDQGDMSYIIRGLGYIKSREDLENIAVGNNQGIPVRVRDIGAVQMGGDLRLGIFDENGQGEVVGGIVVMRYGENADKVIEAVKKKMADVQRGLPAGVTFKVAYDRSELIKAAVGNVREKLIEEMIIVSLIVLLFLLDFRSALSIIIQIPISIATSFILLNAFGLSSNIMSLTGIALAIGVIVDNGIIMSENAYRHLAEEQHLLPAGARLTPARRMDLVRRACIQVSRGVFFSTVIIIASFLPVFLLTGQEGKLFHPLAYTKTFILLVDAVLVVTLAPALISLFMRGRFRKEGANPVSRVLERGYEWAIRGCMRVRGVTLGVNVLVLAACVPLVLSLGREFMPPLDEGTILFMPVTLPDVSNAEMKRLLQVQDKIIASQPEVANVLGKAGRANTATDNSPINMVETIVLLKPKTQWRPGVTRDSIVRELNSKLQIPGVTNGWTQPIINRINMLSTGIRTDVGVKVFGQNLDTINALAQRIRAALNGVPGVRDLYVDPITGGKYLDITVKREEIGRYGLSVDDVNAIVESALGGMKLTTTVEGRQRFSVNARYGQDFRDDLAALRRLQVPTPAMGPIPLEAVADIQLTEGPPMINSENAALRGTVLFNVRDRDLAGTVKEAQQRLDKMLTGLPKGYYIEWSGEYENLIRSERTLTWILPVVLLIIFGAMYFAFRSAREAFFSLISIPFALIGGALMIYFWGVNLSVAVAVGFIALFGLAVETGIVMVIYLNDAMATLVAARGNSRETITRADLREAVIAGAAKRLRPKLMTVSVSLFALIPILWSNGVGSDVMKPIVLPMIGGVLTSATHILLVTPLIFLMTKEYELRKYGKIEVMEVKR